MVYNVILLAICLTKMNKRKLTVNTQLIKVLKRGVQRNEETNTHNGVQHLIWIAE